MSLPNDVASAAQELLEADLAYELSTVEAAAPPPPSIRELNALLAEIEDGKQQIVCHPNDYERLVAAVRASDLSLYYTLVISPVSDPGQALLLPSRRGVLASLAQASY